MKTLFEFEVPGDPRGYTTTTYRDKGRSARYKKYREYCQLVREYASMAGVPIPLTADRDNQLMIRVRAYFRTGVHADVENVRKGCVDAIFYDPLSKKKGDDKWVAGEFPVPLYDQEEPRLEVEICEYLAKPEGPSGLDLCGKKFGDLEVLEYEGVEGGKSRWLCICKCGTTKAILGSKLVGGHSSTCGCGGKIAPMMSFGHLIALRQDVSVSGPRKWICRCACGKEKSINASNLIRGHSRSCGCRGLEYGHCNWNKIYKTYARNAEVRGLKFELSKEEVKKLGSDRCEYCGVKPYREKRGESNDHVVKYNGIDRVDNEVGYEIDNCVTCCSVCNFAKNSMSIQEFNRWRVRLARRTRQTIKLGDEARVPIKLRKKRKKAA